MPISINQGRVFQMPEKEIDLEKYDINIADTKNIQTGINLGLSEKLDIYEALLVRLQEGSSPSHETILQLLLNRDVLQTILEIKEEKSVELILRLSVLDEQLKKQGRTIAQEIDLSSFHESLNPSSNNWWWFFEATQVPIKPKAWDRFDWAWNLLTVICMTGFVSFSSKIIPLIFSNGLGIFESIGLLGTGGMIALILSSIQGGEGQKRLLQMMNRIGIPPQFQSEVVFLIAFTLFSGGYYFQENLPRIYFNDNVTKGITERRNGSFLKAKKSLEEALKINNDHPTIEQNDPLLVANVNGELGLIYETEGNEEQAKSRFNKALQLGDFRSLRRLARLSIYKNNLDEAETLLNLGLQKTNSSDRFGQYLTYTYLGWTYLEQKRYPKAEEILNQAIDLEKQIPKSTLDEVLSGMGIAHCFQARIYELREKPDDAPKQWELCAETALPESLSQYKAILKMNPEIGSRLSSKGILDNHKSRD